MNAHAVLSGLALLASLMLGTFVWAKNPREELNQRFFGLALFFSVLIGSEWLSRHASTAAEFLLFYKIEVIALIIFVVLVSHFLLLFAERGAILRDRKRLATFYGLALVLCFLVAGTSLITAGANQVGSNFMAEHEIAFWIMNVALLAYLLPGLYLCVGVLRQNYPLRKKKQAQILLLGIGLTTALGFFLGVLENYYPFLYPFLSSLRTPSALIFLGAFAYAVLRHGLITRTEFAAEEIVKIAPDSIFIISGTATIARVNQTACNLLGYEEKDLLNQPISLILGEGEGEGARFFKGTSLRKIIREGAVKNYTVTFRSRSGEEIPVMLSGSVLKDDSGGFVGLVCICRDMREIGKLIADLNLAKKASEEKEQQLALNVKRLLDARSATIYMLADLDKTTKELEKAKVELEGFNKGLIEKVKEKTRGLEEKSSELERGQTAMLYMVEDLNRQTKEIKETQEKLVRSEKLAVIGQLASSVAHELRNPLGVMKNALYYLNMLELGKDNPDIKENLGIIGNEIENSDKVISDLLEFSRIKKPNLKPEDINLIIKETLIRIKVPAETKVLTELAENLPPIQGDALQLQQVFYNLATNAIQAMEKGGTLAIKTSFKGDWLETSFTDTGCGIPKDNLRKIFEPLFSTKTKGTGLGLSVVASLVEGHGGKIEIESEVGKGTTFIIELPIKGG